MEPKPMREPSGSPVPGVIPGPIRVHTDGAPADGRTEAPDPTATTEPASSPRRRNPASVLLARLLSALRGDKHLADANPPTRHASAAARVGDEVAETMPDTADRAPSVAPRPEK